MLVVGIVFMLVIMLDYFMVMLMAMLFSQMQPDSQHHQHAGHQQGRVEGFTKKQYGQRCSEKRCHREICACPTRAELAKTDDK